MSPTSGLCRVPRPIARRSPTQADLEDDRVRPGRGAPVTREHGVVYDVGRSMGSLSMNWRPDLTQPLMRRELEHGTTYPDVGWEPKEAFYAVARYYHQQEAA